MTLQHGFELEFKLADERMLQLEQESFENIIGTVFHERLTQIYGVKPKRLAKSTRKKYGIAFRKIQRLVQGSQGLQRALPAGFCSSSLTRGN
jgi:hypothetical protein